MSGFIFYLEQLEWDLTKVIFFLFDFRRTVRQVSTLPLCWRMDTPYTSWTSSFRTVSCKIRSCKEWSTCLSMTGKRISEVLIEQRNIAIIITFSILTLKHFFTLYNKKNHLIFKKKRNNKGQRLATCVMLMYIILLYRIFLLKNLFFINEVFDIPVYTMYNVHFTQHKVCAVL